MCADKHWTFGGRIKIERADKLLTELDAEIVAFTKKDVYTRFTKEDSDTGDLLLGIRASEEPPEQWGALVGDIIHNLRTGLNVLWRATEPTKQRDKDDFVIYNNAAAFEFRFKAKATARRMQAMEALRPSRPYCGGNDALWLLHTLNIQDKHRTLLPVACATVGITERGLNVNSFVTPVFDKSGAIVGVQLGGQSPIVARTHAPPEPQLLQKETIVHRIPANLRGKVDMNPDFILSITFGDVPGVERAPVVAVLDAMYKTTRYILEQFALIP